MRGAASHVGSEKLARNEWRGPDVPLATATGRRYVVGVSQSHYSAPTNVAIVAATVLLPLAGAAVAGRNLSALGEFPPRLDIPSAYPRFSWLAPLLVLAPLVGLAVSWRRAVAGPRRKSLPDEAIAKPAGRLPWWGWAAFGWVTIWWILAWNRFDWFSPLQRYTFFPLWIGFVVAVAALTRRRHGVCLLTDSPARWLALFATSAAFWWVFEWLNRFTRNWHYLGVEDFGALGYAANATLCFSTVLPAVSGVAELLTTSPAWPARCAHGPRYRWLEDRRTGAVLLLAGVASLLGAGAFPQQCYAALWASPLALALAAEILRDDPRSLSASVAIGDWRQAATWAIAALICGAFWELWNVHSAAKWIYTVPYVDRWHAFEMPALGYAGYLPFGLECYFVARVVAGERPFSSVSST